MKKATIALALILALTGCASNSAAPTRPETSQLPEVSAPKPPPKNENEPPLGPGAQVGVAYEFELYTHCGILGTHFDGREWNADPSLTDGQGNPPKGWGNPSDLGRMTLKGPNEAEFRSNKGQIARFVPRPAGAPDPNKNCD